ncbi:MAG: zinc ribbon domain-containing protein [Deltaproteobacteria bacterium]|nr:zinc ribbon domain-containing protein [Deltaproteobacteria bacterium]MBT4525438.1 zinc ribbon domain-containing protein [Deltaproteobacteria bacterium]
MPLFEFKCNDCGYQFEELTSSTATELPLCPECKKADTKKLPSLTSLGSVAGQSGSNQFQAPSCSPGGG